MPSPVLTVTVTHVLLEYLHDHFAMVAVVLHNQLELIASLVLPRAVDGRRQRLHALGFKISRLRLGLGLAFHAGRCGSEGSKHLRDRHIS